MNYPSHHELSYEVTVFIYTLQMRKPRLREVNILSVGIHNPSKWQIEKPFLGLVFSVSLFINSSERHILRVYHMASTMRGFHHTMRGKKTAEPVTTVYHRYGHHSSSAEHTVDLPFWGGPCSDLFTSLFQPVLKLRTSKSKFVNCLLFPSSPKLHIFLSPIEKSPVIFLVTQAQNFGIILIIPSLSFYTLNPHPRPLDRFCF